jgi:hypothetical protein
MQRALADLRVDLKQLEFDHRTNTERLKNGTLNSNIDGVITEIISLETAVSEGLPYITISGGGGYYIRGTLTELEQPGAFIGQVVDVRSPRTELVCEGTIVDIGAYPIGNIGESTGSLSISRYPFTVYVPRSAELNDGEYVSMTLRQDGSQAQTEPLLLLDRSFIRTNTDGSSYVLAAGEDGKLEKREVVTGRVILGYYIEIIFGLDLDDYIAFPFGDNAAVGARTRLTGLGIYPPPSGGDGLPVEESPVPDDEGDVLDGFSDDSGETESV